METDILWKPGEERIVHSKMNLFLNYIAGKYRLPDHRYSTVHDWSVTHVAEFWSEVWEFCNIRYSNPYKKVVEFSDVRPGIHWFEGARLNFAENLLQRTDDKTAIIFLGEDIIKRKLSYKDLYDQVQMAANALLRSGIRKNDRVAAFMPNMPETIIMMLATASIGAIWSSSSPDFGIKGVLDRFRQISPKVIIAADGYYYKGKVFDSQVKLKGILHELPSVEKVVMVDYTGNLKSRDIPGAIRWDEFLVPVRGELEFAQLPFDHPLYIMYSSGTTGLPKSIVHSAGGTLVQHLKELILHTDLRSRDIIFYYTTCGWMMWNWFVSSLAKGATLVLYDGNPFHPGPDALLKMAAELEVTIFGTSAKYISTLESSGVIPKNISSFPHLKTILSTGSPLPEESFDYVYRQWKHDVQLSSIAGGTDIISCFVLGNPVLPVYRGEIQCKGLGMDVDCFDDNGNSLVGEKGELVCKKPFPSMPVYFWNDPEEEKYKNAYFNCFPGIWTHGDYVMITPNEGIIMLGRSDTTLNPGGVRIGTAEIYRVVESFIEINDSVIIGQKYKDDERVILFVKLNSRYIFNPELQASLKAAIRTQCSPRHVPEVIIEVPDIPYTHNGKKVELAVKDIIHGQEVKNKGALANPESLDFFARLQIS